MKKSVYLLLFALLTIQACTDSIPTCEDCNFTCINEESVDVITNVCLDNWECKFRVTAQSNIDLEDNEGLASGDKNVFQMINSTQGSPLIIDDELTNVLVFELDESQSSFTVEDENLKNINTHFRRICYCVENSFKEVTMGCLQGEQQSNGSWKVQGNLTIPYSYGNVEVKIDAVFEN